MVYVMQMQRYQIYLDPQWVSTVDRFADLTNVRRSKQIQALVERYFHLISNLVSGPSPMSKKGPLDDLVGIIKLKSKKKVDLARHVDDVVYGKNLY